MARKTRSPKVIEEVKSNIIDQAMKLILEAGFHNMTIRKLATRVGMSPTNIYYYYASKDEIYLNIQIKGFKLLQKSLEEVAVSDRDPQKALEKMIRAYLKFGFNNPDYYQIMLNSDTPRYQEYKDTNKKIEPIAHKAKQTAINAISVPLKIIAQISNVHGNIFEQDIGFRAYHLWITLHGIITLNNRKILLELNDILPDKLIDRMCKELMHPFYTLKTNISTGECTSEN